MKEGRRGGRRRYVKRGQGGETEKETGSGGK